MMMSNWKQQDTIRVDNIQLVAEEPARETRARLLARPMTQKQAVLQCLRYAQTHNHQGQMQAFVRLRDSMRDDMERYGKTMMEEELTEVLKRW